MKILIFNGYYEPAKNYGGPQTSVRNLINACGKEYVFYVVSANHDFNSKIEFDVPTRRMVSVGDARVIYLKDGDLDYSLSSMLSFIKWIQPDIVWFAGILVPAKKVVGYIAATKLRIPVLFSPRGELNADHVKIKSWKKLPMLWFLRVSHLYKDAYFHATGQDEYDGIIRYLSPRRDHVFQVPNIGLAKQEVKVSNIKEKDHLRCFFISRIHPVKNIHYALDVLSMCKSMITYDIYGPIEDNDYWNSCLIKISRLNPNIQVHYRGFLSREHIPEVVQSHDCLLFMSLNENYSHTIAESLANSRPVVIGKGATPWDDLNGKAGYVESLDNPAQVAKRLDELAGLTAEEFNELIRSTSRYYETSPLVISAISGHKQMFDSILTGYNRNNQ